MWIESLIERWGEPTLLMALGLFVGLLFGSAAQVSRFCMRASTAEVAEFHIGPRTGLWIVAFATAVTGVQAVQALGIVDLSGARQLASIGSMSGAIIGGVMFGIGMVLARGCASRLLVLSATGNLRAIVTGLVLTIVAQAALTGVLSPLREYLGALWVVQGGAERSALALVGIGHGTAALISAAVTVAAVALAAARQETVRRIVASALVGVAVALGWLGTALIAAHSFELVAMSSVTFTGPSADTLMALINERSLPVTFAIGLVPGVFLGSGLAAVLSGEFGIQRFGPDTPMERYLIGAAFMGFGSMLAGGCAVGAAVSGGALMATTAWVAGISMWAGALATHWALAAYPSAAIKA